MGRPYGKLPIKIGKRLYQRLSRNSRGLDNRVRSYRPTLEEASVRLFSVVLLPAEGLPTSPMRGSRGMLNDLMPSSGLGHSES